MKFILALLFAFLAFAKADYIFNSLSSDSCSFSVDTDQCKIAPCLPGAVVKVTNEGSTGTQLYFGPDCSSFPVILPLVCDANVTLTQNHVNYFYKFECNPNTVSSSDENSYNEGSSAASVYVSFTILLLGLLAALL
ncbi:hypothetical protein DICPUDRAFT_82224 [Dictyostelium purpureum]|uniref:Uncharacterized protein n=1 Tax=Dictyostelium purpureum TaxID=5786 RepID=F0ZVW2_DICPU|nr:uncharacterized protein DICPUDRAFT_82224 [Dictyostelium purpureum]EGC31923.1 hypothetical protein DICPUDRAFT_82224 [Dictyostelium purpureum]|eukprot:XP_003291560.1 hypothetical protein DICPUDRAFT_82224 [Dictyostelium purpureum]